MYPHSGDLTVRMHCYFGAMYTFTTDDHTCEGEIRLTEVSDEMFPDNGHAIAWAMQH